MLNNYLHKCTKGAVNEYKRLGKVDSDGLNKLL